MKTVEMEIGDTLYLLEVSGFHAAEEARMAGPQDGPPAGGEVELEDVVLAVDDSDLPFSERPRRRLSLRDFTALYADCHDLNLAEATSALYDEVYEDVCEQYAADADSRWDR